MASKPTTKKAVKTPAKPVAKKPAAKPVVKRSTVRVSVAKPVSKPRRTAGTAYNPSSRATAWFANGKQKENFIFACFCLGVFVIGVVVGAIIW